MPVRRGSPPLAAGSESSETCGASGAGANGAACSAEPPCAARALASEPRGAAWGGWRRRRQARGALQEGAAPGRAAAGPRLGGQRERVARAHGRPRQAARRRWRGRGAEEAVRQRVASARAACRVECDQPRQQVQRVLARLRRAGISEAGAGARARLGLQRHPGPAGRARRSGAHARAGRRPAEGSAASAAGSCTSSGLGRRPA